MNDIQIEERSSKKKLLVPLVVLMLCALSIVGVGYAYSTTVTNSGNNIEPDYYSIDLYKGDNSVVTGDLEFSGKVTVYTEKTDNKVVVKAKTTAGNLGKVAVFKNNVTPETTEKLVNNVVLKINSVEGFTKDTTVESGLTWFKDVVVDTDKTCKVTMVFSLGDYDAGYRAINLNITIADATVEKEAGVENPAAPIAKAVSTAIKDATYSLTCEYTIEA